MAEGEAAPEPEAPKTTTSGAHGLFQANAWLTAAAVALYSTQALWAKLRNLGLAKSKKGAPQDPEQLPNAIPLKNGEMEDYEEDPINAQLPVEEEQQPESKLQVFDVDVF